MKNMMEKRMFRAAAVLLCASGLTVGAAMAQQDAPPPPPDGAMQGPPPGGPGRGGPEHRLDAMQKHLGLSDDQKAQIKSIFEGQRAKMEAVHSNASLSEQDRRAQMRVIREEGDVKIHAVLTPDQKTKYDAMEARQHDRMEGRRGGPDGPPPADAPQPPANPQQ